MKTRLNQIVAMSLVVAFVLTFANTSAHSAERWSERAAREWYARQPWIVGSNYIPATAINELEMWQADTFDSVRIDKELGWVEGLGMNTMRVFLHDLLWQQDAEGFKKRIDIFLSIAAKHHIKPLFVLFDSVWDPDSKLGKQREPISGVHNSGWVQSPGRIRLQDPKQEQQLAAYVKGVVGAFAKDQRILGWDIWNEPDNTNGGEYHKLEPANKVDLVLALLPKTFDWAREVGATQPLTSGVWQGDWSSPEKLSPMAKAQIALSDVISFHNYDKAEEFEKRIVWLKQYRRPLICTEYMARGNGSTFQGSLPIALKYHVGAINWGLVAGKTQTFLPWDSWEHPYTDRGPSIWFHEVFRTNGQPYKQDEYQFIQDTIASAQNKTK